MLRPITLVLLSWLIAMPLFSQTERFTQSDQAFFQKTAEQYDRWLKSVGLSPLITVEKVILKNNDDTELELHLLMTTHDVDVAVAQWRALRGVMAKGKADSTILEKTLYETFARQMQIPSEQGNIQIYVRDVKGQYIPCFYVGIWYENGDIKTDARFNSCKAKPLDISVTLPPLRTPKGKTATVQSPSQVGASPLSNNAVFDKIQRFAREQFEKTLCHDRYPKVEMDYAKSRGNVLVFSVTDLCHVVLKDEDKSLWCKIYQSLGGECNDIRRERLIFTFNYETLSNNAYRLTGELQGLFGSGVFKPRVSGYMDMEPDFDDYISAYANEFQGRLKAYLEK